MIAILNVFLSDRYIEYIAKLTGLFSMATQTIDYMYMSWPSLIDPSPALWSRTPPHTTCTSQNRPFHCFRRHIDWGQPNLVATQHAIYFLSNAVRYPRIVIGFFVNKRLFLYPKLGDNKGKTLSKVSDQFFGRNRFSSLYAYVIGYSKVNRGL